MDAAHLDLIHDFCREFTYCTKGIVSNRTQQKKLHSSNTREHVRLKHIGKKEMRSRNTRSLYGAARRRWRHRFSSWETAISQGLCPNRLLTWTDRSLGLKPRATQFGSFLCSWAGQMFLGLAAGGIVLACFLGMFWLTAKDISWGLA